MNFSLLNFYSALGIGVVIGAMASIKNVRHKALLYVLPIPISIGLIATHGVVNGSTLFGLLLIWLFLILVRFLADVCRVPILVADVLASAVYIAIGYVLAHFVHWPFIRVVALFIAAWTVVVWWMHQHPITEKPTRPSALPPIAKGAIASLVSFGIYSFKGLLAGAVVTFPYNGVFAVVEVRQHLAVFNRAVIRNSAAIAALFVVMYYGHAHLNLPLNLLAGWLGFGAVLWFVNHLSV